MLKIANNLNDATTASGSFRAGGTDYMDRLRHGLATDEIVDVMGIQGLDQVSVGENGRTQIGALTTIFTLSQTPHIVENYFGLAQAAGGLATPQIRLIGTVGGNLTQATRCQYFRHQHLQCTKKGDATCGGREGYHPNGVIFDHGGCAHPHPSTLGMALMAYDAEVEINGESTRSIFDLYGDGSDHGKDHLLAENELMTQIILPAPVPEQAAYFRASQRARAEWATVESVVRLVMDGDTIEQAFVAVGAVASVPMRLKQVEAALVGKTAVEETFISASQQAAEGANPLRDTTYKVSLMVHSLAETMRRAINA